MILVILGISLLILVIGIIWGVVDDWYNSGTVILTTIGILVGVISLIATLIIGVTVSENAVIDQKIEMYQSENQKIETQIAEVVEQYKEYEGETFEKFKPEDVVVFASLYPELKSNELVSKQIAVYVENNDKIKELKEANIVASVYRWWLYFGE